MLEYLRGVSDQDAKRDVVRRIGELAERFAPDTQWFVDTMNQVGLESHHLAVILGRCGCSRDRWSLQCSARPNPSPMVQGYLSPNWFWQYSGIDYSGWVWIECNVDSRCIFVVAELVEASTECVGEHTRHGLWPACSFQKEARADRCFERKRQNGMVRHRLRH